MFAGASSDAEMGEVEGRRSIYLNTGARNDLLGKVQLVLASAAHTLRLGKVQLHSPVQWSCNKE